MAKQQNTPDPAEVVIFYARARGGGPVVAESVRALAEAVERAAQPRAQSRVVKALPADARHDERTLFDPVEEPQGAKGEGETADTIDVVSESEPRAKRGQGHRKDRNAGIQLVGDIDFVPNDRPSLRSFFAEKACSFDVDQVLVLCYYMQRVLALPKYGTGHVLTAFKHVEEPVPVDLKQTIRNLKKKAWLSFTDLDDLRVTTVGENRVEHELGRNGRDTEAP